MVTPGSSAFGIRFELDLAQHLINVFSSYIFRHHHSLEQVCRFWLMKITKYRPVDEATVLAFAHALEDKNVTTIMVEPDLHLSEALRAANISDLPPTFQQQTVVVWDETHAKAFIDRTVYCL